MEIIKNIHFVGISTNEEKLFENLWELDYGVTYNSYLLIGEKVALIEGCPSKYFPILKENIEKICPLKNLSYLVLNHLEPDHSEAVLNLLEDAPNLEILTTKMGVSMLLNFYGVKERVKEVKDGETIDLGTFSLKFISSPFIHWPETMMTFEEKSKTLFSGDCFGGFGELKDTIFAEENKDAIFEEERYRYFVNILSSYTKHIEKAITKIEALNPQNLCPSHGYIFKEPQNIISTYKKWCSYSNSPQESYIPIVVSTMYGVSFKAAELIKQVFEKLGFCTAIWDLTSIQSSHILKEIYKAKALVIVSSTYDGGLFPKMADFLFRAKAKEIKNKKVLFLGSFAWGGGAFKEFDEWAKRLNWQVVASVEFKGAYDMYKEKLEEAGVSFIQSIKD